MATRAHVTAYLTVPVEVLRQIPGTYIPARFTDDMMIEGKTIIPKGAEVLVMKNPAYITEPATGAKYPAYSIAITQPSIAKRSRRTTLSRRPTTSTPTSLTSSFGGRRSRRQRKN